MAIHMAGNTGRNPARRRARSAGAMKSRGRQNQRRGATSGSVYDALATDIAILEREIRTTKRKLLAARDEAESERSCLLLGLLATEQRLFEKKTEELSSVFQEAGPALDEALAKLDGVVRAAQRLSSAGVD
jgi:hypothetical protein